MYRIEDQVLIELSHIRDKVVLMNTGDPERVYASHLPNCTETE